MRVLVLNKALYIIFMFETSIFNFLVLIKCCIKPFPHTAISQQTFRKILNVHSEERNEHFFKLESFENIVANEEIAPAGAIFSSVTMFSNVVCCSRR